MADPSNLSTIALSETRLLSPEDTLLTFNGTKERLLDCFAIYRGSAMRDYRMYALDGAGLIDRAARIERLHDDRAAVVAAEKLGHHHTVEIWEGARWVANVNAGR